MTFFPIKIAIIGTHSTGKSTIIRHLRARLEGCGYTIAILKELSRQCPLPIDRNTTYDAQRWIQDQHVLREPQLMTMCDILICDRSSLDNFAYMQRGAQEHDLAEDEQRAVAHMESYTHVFKTTKLNLPAEDDGVRDTDQAFRDDIDARIHALLQKHNIEVYHLPETLDYDTHLDVICRELNLPTTRAAGV